MTWRGYSAIDRESTIPFTTPCTPDTRPLLAPAASADAPPAPPSPYCRLLPLLTRAHAPSPPCTTSLLDKRPPAVYCPMYLPTRVPHHPSGTPRTGESSLVHCRRGTQEIHLGSATLPRNSRAISTTILCHFCILEFPFFCYPSCTLSLFPGNTGASVAIPCPSRMSSSSPSFWAAPSRTASTHGLPKIYASPTDPRRSRTCPKVSRHFSRPLLGFLVRPGRPWEGEEQQPLIP